MGLPMHCYSLYLLDTNFEWALVTQQHWSHITNGQRLNGFGDCMNTTDHNRHTEADVWGGWGGEEGFKTIINSSCLIICENNLLEGSGGGGGGRGEEGGRRGRGRREGGLNLKRLTPVDPLGAGIHVCLVTHSIILIFHYGMFWV